MGHVLVADRRKHGAASDPRCRGKAGVGLGPGRGLSAPGERQPFDEACPVCLSIAGVARISPAPTIHEGRYWLVEHAYPTALVGWLVLVLKRHAEALHGISRAEGVELGLLQWAVSRALHAVTGSLKEYSVFFAEKPGFGHVHVHLVPRAHDLDPELRSGGVFAYLRVGADEAAPPAEVQALCARISLELRDLLEGVGAR